MTDHNDHRPAGPKDPYSAAALAAVGGKESRLAQLMADDEIGEGGHRFRLVRPIGTGGMGVVWEAVELDADDREEIVAIKMLPAEVALKATDKKRLREEAQRARKLGHPNIVQVFGWHEDPSGILFLVMERLHGRPLDEVLAAEGTPGVCLPRALELLRPIADAIDWAWKTHEIVHRDLKPGNVMLTDAGVIKVLDFGLSAEARGSSGGSALIQDRSGTIEYMPPEAKRLHKVKPSRDIFALAVMTYELLQGQCPWPAEAAGYRLEEKTDADWPDAPSGLNLAQWRALRRGLAYRPEDRPATAREMLDAVEMPSSGAGGGGQRFEFNARTAWFGAVAALLIGIGIWWAMQPSLPVPDPGPTPGQRAEELARERDEAAWQVAQKTNSEAGYGVYLTIACATGPCAHRDEADKARADQRAARERAEAQARAEQERLAKLAADTDARQKALDETARQLAAQRAEADSKAKDAAAERDRLAKLAGETEAKRRDQEAAAKRLANQQAEADRKAEEAAAERERLVKLAQETEAKRRETEAEVQRLAEQKAEAERKAREAAAERERQAKAKADADARKQALQDQQAVEIPQGGFVTMLAKRLAAEAVRVRTAANLRLEHPLGYAKLDAQSRELPDDAAAWTMVLDLKTGLMWEHKTDDGGLRDKGNTFSWYDPKASDGNPGKRKGGKCTGGIDCDTQGYVEAVNRMKLGGYADWRMPTVEELKTLVAKDQPYGWKLRPEFFADKPDDMFQVFWSASVYAGLPRDAWFVHFGDGIDVWDARSAGMFVRLVREGQ